MTAAPRILDLDTVQIEDGPGLARMVTRLRRLSDTTILVLRNCPQMLAHTLYKAGILDQGRIRIESMRSEEPFG